MSQVITQTSASCDLLHLQSGLSSHLGSKFQDYPKLSREQCGHIRHFHNLASTLEGEWGLMGGQDPDQEWGTAYRYQLSCMVYAAGAAHYHRLPAMRSMFKPLLEKLIAKMLRREVWHYWYLMSQSGVKIDPDIKELRKPWADPCLKENIMVCSKKKKKKKKKKRVIRHRLYRQQAIIPVPQLLLTWEP